MPIRAPWPFDAAGRRFLGRTVKRCGLALLLAVQAVPVLAAHGYAQYGDLKYGPDFTHFDYANPAAPRRHADAGQPGPAYQLDKFNPFTLKGTAARG